jgi:hypothetical protein
LALAVPPTPHTFILTVSHDCLITNFNLSGGL